MSSAYRAAIDQATGVLRAGRVVGQRWPDQRLVYYPRGARLGQAGTQPVWETMHSGVVVATTTMHEHTHPALQEETPFTLVLVDIEGARLICRLDPGARIPQRGDRVDLRVDEHPSGPRVVAS